MGLLGMTMPGMGDDEEDRPQEPQDRKRKNRLRKGLEGIMGQ
jgi:hypothetical protein